MVPVKVKFRLFCYFLVNILNVNLVLKCFLNIILLYVGCSFFNNKTRNKWEKIICNETFRLLFKYYFRRYPLLHQYWLYALFKNILTNFWISFETLLINFIETKWIVILRNAFIWYFQFIEVHSCILCQLTVTSVRQ